MIFIKKLSAHPVSRITHFVTMGGTFTSTLTPWGLRPTQKGSAIIEAALNSKNLMRVSSHVLMNKDSSLLTLNDILILNRWINEIKQRPEIKSVVVLMGTDNLENVSFLLSLLCPPKTKPIILTGAMIPYGSKDSDALINIKKAFRVSQFFPENFPPVLVTFQNHILDGLSIRKTSTRSLIPFIDTKKMSANRRAQEIIENKDFYLNQHNLIFPKVRTISIGPGEDSSAISDAVKNGCEIIILDGLGNGNVSQETLEQVAAHREKAIFVVSSQVLEGDAKPLYGPAYSLKDKNAVFSGTVNARKSVILSILFLSQPHIQKLSLIKKRIELQKAFDLINE
jgi:L-asparaginase